jgi:hypothetical protein
MIMTVTKTRRRWLALNIEAQAGVALFGHGRLEA